MSHDGRIAVRSTATGIGDPLVESRTVGGARIIIYAADGRAATASRSAIADVPLVQPQRVAVGRAVTIEFHPGSENMLSGCAQILRCLGLINAVRGPIDHHVNVGHVAVVWLGKMKDKVVPSSDWSKQSASMSG